MRERDREEERKREREGGGGGERGCEREREGGKEVLDPREGAILGFSPQRIPHLQSDDSFKTNIFSKPNRENFLSKNSTAKHVCWDMSLTTKGFAMYSWVL